MTDFRTSKRVVVIAPGIQEGSEIELDWKVELKGLGELPTYLVTERSNAIDLTETEMLAIPELLHCTRWADVAALIGGGLTDPDAPAPTPEPPVATPVPEAVPAVPEAVPGGWQRLREGLFGSWIGRLAATGAALLLLAAGGLLARSGAPQVVAIDQPRSLIVLTQPPAGGGDGGGAFTPSEVWAEYQPIGRRRSLDGEGWVTVGAENIASDLDPEVVVVLEQVDFRDGQIKLSWSLRNNGDEPVRLPLTSQNIAIRDTQGTEYLLDDARSTPAVIEAAAGKQARGTAVVPLPVNLNALSVFVKLRREPFGEATWLVSTGR